MTQLVEVQILEHTIVLACTEESTVADITAAAVAEFLTFNLKSSPRKVLYTRDSKGRILSGSLRLLHNKIDARLEVVVAEYTANDTLSPKGALELYRDWQFWTACQVQEAVHSLSIQDVPSTPQPDTLLLLYELCKTPAERVQLLCAKILQLLLTKFSQHTLVVEAAEQICKLFISTPHVNVAIASLDCFMGLSPLQARVFDGAKYVRDMFNVPNALARFPEDKQGMVFTAFERIAGILGDKELNKVVGIKFQEELTNTEIPLLKSNSFLICEQETCLKSRPGSGIILAQATVPPIPHAEPNMPARPSQAGKRINLKRLESLLSSDDGKVRMYALEKLLKLLTLSAKAHSEIKLSLLVDVDCGGAEEGSAPEAEAEEGSAVNIANYKFTFLNGKEVDSLVKCLFRCLKRCIHARPKRTGNKSPLDSAEDSPDLVPATSEKSRKTITAGSTAGRLIQTAMLSSLSDERSVMLVVDCLWQVVHFPKDIAQDVQFPLGLAWATRRRLKMNGTQLTNVQLVFANAAREWYRLLLTLSHIDEGDKLRSRADLAEKCAYFFIIAALHTMPGGWKEAEVDLEAPAVSCFVAGKQPTFRSYLALSYLASLTGSCFPAEESTHLPAETVSKAVVNSSQGLQDILYWRDYDVSASLWRWATAQDRARKSALLSLSCLANCCAFSSFAAFMFKLDPITRLASILQQAVRDEKKEKQEFLMFAELENTHTLSSDIDDAGSREEDDWDADPDSFCIPVTVPIDESGDGIDESDVAKLSLVAKSSALERMLKRGNVAVNAAIDTKMVASQVVYPDVALIRLLLKTVANLLGASRSSGIYSEEYRGEVSNWLSEVEVGPPGENSGKIRLSRIASKDEVIKFYYNLITHS